MDSNELMNSEFEVLRQRFIDTVVRNDQETPLSDLERIQRAKLILMTGNPMFLKSKAKIMELEKRFLKERGRLDADKTLSNSYLSYADQPAAQEGPDGAAKKFHQRLSLQQNFDFFNIGPQPNAKLRFKDATAKKNRCFQHLVKQQERKLRRIDSQLLDQIQQTFTAQNSLVFVRAFLKGQTVDAGQSDDAFHPFNFFDCQFNDDFRSKKRQKNFAANNFLDFNDVERIDDIIFSTDRTFGNLYKVLKVARNRYAVWIQKETNTQLENFNFRFAAAFAYKREERIEFQIKNVNRKLTQACSRFSLFARVNGKSWERGVEAAVEEGGLRFVYLKKENTEMVEFSLFPPFLVQRIWDFVEEFIAAKRRAKGMPMVSEPIALAKVQDSELIAVTDETETQAPLQGQLGAPNEAIVKPVTRGQTVRADPSGFWFSQL